MNIHNKKWFKRIHNKRGSLFITSYLLLTVLLILGAAFVVTSVNESRSVEREKRIAQALYIAEAGIERALCDLRHDFLNDLTSPSWSDGDIVGYVVGPNTAAYYTIPYSTTVNASACVSAASALLNNGNYTAQLKNTGSGDSIWVKSTGTVGDTTQSIEVYAKVINISPWNNAIFAGAGAAGALVNGNVNIRGSVHILGNGLLPTQYAIDLGGTAELVGNNYNSLSASLLAKVPALPTTVVGGETVSTLNASLRVKRGKIGLSGSSSVGESNVTGNSVKEKIDGSYVTDGFGGTQGSGSVYSDNGWSNGYDLGNTIAFPSLNDAYAGTTYQLYLKANALVLTGAQVTQMANITPGSSFNYSNAKGSISMDGSGNMTVSGIVYIDGGTGVTTLGMSKSGPQTTINYTGTGSILSTGNVQIDVNLITPGNNSYPNNIIGVMTPGSIGFNAANIDVMGLFYGETSIVSQKQTDVMGTFVSNFFDMGTNVPSIYQVPTTVNHLPPGLIGQTGTWAMQVVSWQKL